MYTSLKAVQTLTTSYEREGGRKREREGGREGGEGGEREEKRAGWREGGDGGRGWLEHSRGKTESVTEEEDETTGCVKRKNRDKKNKGITNEVPKIPCANGT